MNAGKNKAVRYREMLGKEKGNKETVILSTSPKDCWGSTKIWERFILRPMQEPFTLYKNVF